MWDHIAINADLRDVAVDSIYDFSIAASADDGLFGFLLDLDGSEDQLRALLFAV